MYGEDSNRFALLTEALDKLQDRDGKDALKDFDGVFFLYAGERVQTIRGGLYWPHRSSVRYHGKNWAYFICPEGGDRMASISVVAHEFGHMLGLPDLYSQSPDQPGLGVWCTMSVGHGQDGKPLHFCAWSQGAARLDQAGRDRPDRQAEIDPFAHRKLAERVLQGAAQAGRQRVPAAGEPGAERLRPRPAGRGAADLARGGRPADSGGVARRPDAGRPAALPRLGAVPQPANTAFTPYTTPSSKAVNGDGLPVHITNIRRLPDGRITFFIGYEFV